MFGVMVILCNTRLGSVKHLINRVLELDEESELPTGRIDTESDPGATEPFDVFTTKDQSVRLWRVWFQHCSKTRA